MYGDGSSDDDFSTDFNLPDLRGYFLRGWDHNLVGEDERQAVDPDRFFSSSTAFSDRAGQHPSPGRFTVQASTKNFICGLLRHRIQPHHRLPGA